jgi:hypothetical protein
MYLTCLMLSMYTWAESSHRLSPNPRMSPTSRRISTKTAPGGQSEKKKF